ncbi:hypothetical protein E9993_13055 [Labilibacter sediminis]|nr:hypothetical protein E9993_13055 [Labilibacter sediminis]
MVKINAFILLLLTLFSFTTDSFKSHQLRYPRVREAYKSKESNMLNLINAKNINRGELLIYLRAFKSEKKIELWGKNKSDQTYQLIKAYEVCRTSGKLGPKRRQGDLQIPEGFYHINIFNPYSNFYLSMGINYPNKSDRILGVKNKLGGDIFIHGACVTIGCLPITNEEIKELYIFCVEAKNNGQQKIPVSIFPCKLNSKKFEQLSLRYKSDSDKIGLWTDLKKGYDSFNQNKQLPSISFLNTGRHIVK